MDLLNIEIETERLRLIPVSEKYREDIFREFDKEITIYMVPKPAEKIEETDTFISSTIENMKKGEEIVLSILKKDSGEFVGITGLHHIDTLHPHFGVWTKKSSHGNKYGREALQGFKKWADENIKYEYIVYPVDKKNIASRKIAESLGGVIEDEYEKVGMGGQQLDEVEYRIYPSK